MLDEREYFVIKVYETLPDERHIGYLKTIDKITDSYIDNSGNEIKSDYIDVIVTDPIRRAKTFDTITEAREWMKKVSSNDCHYKKYGMEYIFEIVFCRKVKEVVAWENSKKN